MFYNKEVPLQVRLAAADEVSTLVSIINAAFKVEKFFIERDRIDHAEVAEKLEKGKFLVAESADGVAGCVYVELQGDRSYFGLLSVDPARQKSGVGRLLVEAAESHCRERGSRAMDLTIVNLRAELPAFYQRLGYAETGTAPFRTDVTTKIPCHFVWMSKPL